MAEAEIKVLTKKRATIKAGITRFLNFISEFGENAPMQELQARLANHERTYTEFETIQSGIEELTAEDTVNHDTERKNFERLYYKAVASAKQILERASPRSSSSTTLSHVDLTTGGLNSVKLPVINLPEFRGDYADWYKFRDSFNTLVHNTSLPNIQKFMYLTLALKGPASEVIESLEISDESYQVALDLLKERYENPKLIVNTHVKAIFDLEVITKENHALLRKLLDQFLKHYRALDGLKQPVSHWDTLLIHILTIKLDSKTRKCWEGTQNITSLPTLDHLLTFLKSRCQILETMNNNSNLVQRSTHEKPKFKALSNFATHTSPRMSCIVCKGSHSVYQCKDFLALKPIERYERIKSLNACVNCLAANHNIRNCKSRTCYRCQKRHHTLLHRDEVTAPQNAKVNDFPKDAQTTIMAHCLSKQMSYVLLSTAVVELFDQNGQSIRARVLIDSGSDSHYMTRALFNKLGIIGKVGEPITIAGLNNTISSSCHRVKTKIRSLHTPYERELNILIIDNITQDIPLRRFDVSNIEMPTHVKLADPSFNVPGKIDMLIGAEIFYELLDTNKIRLGKNRPVLQSSKLGWLVTGTINLPYNSKKNTPCYFGTRNQNDLYLDEALKRFWALDECVENTIYTEEESLCEADFIKNTIRNTDGRYVVSLPFNERKYEMGDSFTNAVTRFQKLERRLEQNDELKRDYSDFMREYENLGHMIKLRDISVNEGSFSKNSKFCVNNELNESGEYYIPHHAVIKASSSTTKLRVVFDASAPTTSGISLNNALRVGPIIQSDLFAILIRFRKHAVVISADIEKMFRQVLVSEEHCNFQKIIWRDDTNKPLGVYQLRTVTYGTGPATFLTTRCLKDLALENFATFPSASRAILRDTYVDDVIAGAIDAQNAIKLKNDLIKMLQSGCFQLRKWSSNAPEVLQDCLHSNSEIKHLIKDPDDKRTLGVIWNPDTDTLGFVVDTRIVEADTVTKRTILGTIARVFDPLGIVAPVVVRARIFLQSLWHLNLGWDDPVPNDILVTWKDVNYEVNELHKLIIPRKVLCNDAADIQLCGFCDSSERAYGANIYIRSVDKSGTVMSRLLCSKSRVAPISTVRQMADLPATRITPSRPFLFTALDMAGPFMVKETKLRNRRIVKVYACIFVCFTTKAVHIEIVSDLTCECFLNCLKRFTARRGLPQTLYSDNGGSFVAASKELKSAHIAINQFKSTDAISSYILNNKIDWRFMPPRAPNFGGLHEAAVKSMKRYLSKVTHNTVLTIESLSTILCQVEAILNSRPLYPSSDDPTDPTALTPGHFLIGGPLLAVPQINVTELQTYKLSEYRKLQQTLQALWRRWSKEYLSNLQTRGKWKIDHGVQPLPGALVIIREENLPPQFWPMGRIVELYYGPDNTPRIARLRTSKGEVKRAINRLCVLPVDDI